MRFILTFFLLLTTVIVYSQNSFQRFYRHNNEDVINLDAIQLSNLHYLTVDGVFEDSDTSFQSILFTIYDIKGTIQSSSTFRLETDTLEFSINGRSALIETNTNNIYFTTILNSETASNRLTLILDPGLGIVTSASYSAADEEQFSVGDEVYLTKSGDNSIYQSYNGVGTTTLNKFNLNGALELTKRYEQQLSDSSLADISTYSLNTSKDSLNLLMTGLENEFLTFDLVELDLDGDVTLGQRYIDTFLSDDELRIYYGTRVEKALDSSFIVAGDYLYFDLENFVNSKAGSFIAKMDKFGELLWAKRIGFPTEYFNSITNIELSNDGTIFVAGFYDSGEVDIEYTPFSFFLNPDGSIRNANQYPQYLSLGESLRGNAFGVKNEGYAMVVPTLFDGISSLNVLIRMDTNGETPCSDTLAPDFLHDITTLIADTMVWVAEDVDSVTVTEYEMVKEGYGGYAVPELTLAARPFCPNEPIDWTFDARGIPGAVAYLWNTGATSDTLRVDEEDTYDVMVTVLDSFSCYVLCDTAMIGRYDEPTISLASSPGNFCDNGLITVILQGQFGAPVTSVTWSTGDTGVAVIETSMEGTITVNIVDECMEQAMAEIEIVRPELLLSANITSDFSAFCQTGNGILRVNAVGGVVSTLWNTGATTTTIPVNTPGNYSVVVSDFCDKEISANITITPDQIPKIVGDITFAFNSDDLCNSGVVSVLATINGNFNSIRWDNGSTQPAIQVEPGRTYVLEVTDDCKTVDAEVFVPNVDLACVKFPKVFLPYGSLAENKTFGGFTEECLSVGNINNFEFAVFNRWGQQVFSTNDVSERWDGMHKTEIAPTDVYVWYAKYNDGDCPIELKGDVTLLR